MEEQHFDLDLLFKEYVNKINLWLPDGVIEVDLDLLHKYDLLHFHEKSENSSSLTRYFHVAETDEKLVLVNNEFVVWIVPEKNSIEPKTFTLIALNKDKEIQPEMAFRVSGVYNNSFLVLRLLEQFLLEIHHTEDLITRLETQLAP